ncbi:MAG TPA: HRDC domain-containing protein [Anaerolineales bacterium]|nr:HRDC domain-containing protein [Anaerolineales bacterium]
MQTGSLKTPLLITRTGPLHQLAERIAPEPIVAVDTESNSLYAYQEQVCLIQLSTSQEDFLVDPLELNDLSPLAPLFADPKIEKVFHAAEYDIVTMKRDFGFSFTNLFDTMLAARILGWDEMGLGAILKAEFDVELNKRYQRANWGKRPLPEDMLDYARLDSHYLIPLRHRMKAELKASGRWPLALEDFRRLCHINGRDPDEAPVNCWRISGSYDLSPEQAAVLQDLCLYRDQVARNINQPVFKVLGDRTLLAIAERMPRDWHQLEKVGELSQKQMQRHGESLLRSVARGLQAGPLRPPRSPRPDDQYLVRLDALRNWRKNTAQGMGVNSDVVLPRDLLQAIASLKQVDRPGLSAVLNQVPWRLEHFGEEILNLLKRL